MNDIEKVDALYEKMSSIEETISKLKQNPQKFQIPEHICGCWIKSIDFHDNGTIRNLQFGNPRQTCVKCFPTLNTVMR